MGSLRRRMHKAGSTDTLRDLVLEAWHAVDRDGAPLHEALSGVFKLAQQLTSEQRGRVVDTLDYMVAQRRRIFYALDGAGMDGLPRSRKSEAFYLAARVLKGSMSADTAARECPGIQWDAVNSVDTRVLAEKDETTRLGVRFSMPDLLVNALRENYPDTHEKLLAALNREPLTSLRVNTLKSTREKVLQELKDLRLQVYTSRLAETALVLKQWRDVMALDSFKRGWFEIQDISSQLCAKLVAPPPQGITVDFCAGAGGKTLALAGMLNGRGRLVALDTHERRLNELRRRAKRAGVPNLKVLALPETKAPLSECEELKFLVGKAERVLVDAPCSGTGVLARKPDIRWRIDEKELERLPKQQEAIARRAMDLVAPGGRLIYATCSLLRAENGEVVEKLLSDERFTLVQPKEILGSKAAGEISDETGKYMKLLPNVHKTDGFFAAVLRRKKA